MSNGSNHKPMLLTEWLLKQTDEQLPSHGGIPYRKRLENVMLYLNEQVHPHVEKGALQNNDGFLNDHGPKHIETVIQRASALLSHPQHLYPKLSAYEVYLLLLAIHFHDVGNIYGREGHEEKHARVMAHMKSLVSDEMVERQAVLIISRAHGGRINGDKDTISTLPQDDHILGHDVRYRTLAAILRFSDELADDCHRASPMLIDLEAIPKESEVYHFYSRCLHSVKVRPHENVVDLRFSFVRENATRTFGKMAGKNDDGTPKIEEVYLLDEIFSRTLKMFLEAKYCMRFMQSVTRIEAIDVRIEVYDDDNSMVPCIDPIGYRLCEHGYPAVGSESIRSICPEIRIDGVGLEKHLTAERDHG